MDADQNPSRNLIYDTCVTRANFRMRVTERGDSVGVAWDCL
jgi:hypothetical protein